jgi:ABC-type transport system involved in cytochrome c biogenesis permease component
MFTEFRTKDALTSMLLFRLLVILMFHLRSNLTAWRRNGSAGAAMDDLFLPDCWA